MPTTVPMMAVCAAACVLLLAAPASLIPMFNRAQRAATQILAPAIDGATALALAEAAWQRCDAAAAMLRAASIDITQPCTATVSASQSRPTVSASLPTLLPTKISRTVNASDERNETAASSSTDGANVTTSTPVPTGPSTLPPAPATNGSDAHSEISHCFRVPDATDGETGAILQQSLAFYSTQLAAALDDPSAEILLSLTLLLEANVTESTLCGRLLASLAVDDRWTLRACVAARDGTANSTSANTTAPPVLLVSEPSNAALGGGAIAFSTVRNGEIKTRVAVPAANSAFGVAVSDIAVTRSVRSVRWKLDDAKWTAAIVGITLALAACLACAAFACHVGAVVAGVRRSIARVTSFLHTGQANLADDFPWTPFAELRDLQRAVRAVVVAWGRNGCFGPSFPPSSRLARLRAAGRIEALLTEDQRRALGPLPSSCGALVAAAGAARAVLPASRVVHVRAALDPDLLHAPAATARCGCFDRRADSDGDVEPAAPDAIDFTFVARERPLERLRYRVAERLAAYPSVVATAFVLVPDHRASGGGGGSLAAIENDDDFSKAVQWVPPEAHGKPDDDKDAAAADADSGKFVLKLRVKSAVSAPLLRSRRLRVGLTVLLSAVETAALALAAHFLSSLGQANGDDPTYSALPLLGVMLFLLLGVRVALNVAMTVAAFARWAAFSSDGATGDVEFAHWAAASHAEMLVGVACSALAPWNVCVLCVGAGRRSSPPDRRDEEDRLFSPMAFDAPASMLLRRPVSIWLAASGAVAAVCGSGVPLCLIAFALAQLPGDDGSAALISCWAFVAFSAASCLAGLALLSSRSSFVFGDSAEAEEGVARKTSVTAASASAADAAAVEMTASPPSPTDARPVASVLLHVSLQRASAHIDGMDTVEMQTTCSAFLHLASAEARAYGAVAHRVLSATELLVVFLDERDGVCDDDERALPHRAVACCAGMCKAVAAGIARWSLDDGDPPVISAAMAWQRCEGEDSAAAVRSEFRRACAAAGAERALVALFPAAFAQLDTALRLAHHFGVTLVVPATTAAVLSRPLDTSDGASERAVARTRPIECVVPAEQLDSTATHTDPLNVGAAAAAAAAAPVTENQSEPATSAIQDRTFYEVLLPGADATQRAAFVAGREILASFIGATAASAALAPSAAVSQLRAQVMKFPGDKVARAVLRRALGDARPYRLSTPFGIDDIGFVAPPQPPRQKPALAGHAAERPAVAAAAAAAAAGFPESARASSPPPPVPLAQEPADDAFVAVASVEFDDVVVAAAESVPL